jgi:hypothetical protein
MATRVTLTTKEEDNIKNYLNEIGYDSVYHIVPIQDMDQRIDDMNLVTNLNFHKSWGISSLNWVFINFAEGTALCDASVWILRLTVQCRNCSQVLFSASHVATVRCDTVLFKYNS